MTTLTLPFPSGRGAAPRRSGVLRLLNRFADGLREGIELAKRFDTLNSKTDPELARMGLRREDIPQAVLAGKVR